MTSSAYTEPGIFSTKDWEVHRVTRGKTSAGRGGSFRDLDKKERHMFKSTMNKEKGGAKKHNG